MAPITGRLMAGGSVETRVRTMAAAREDTVQRNEVTIREFRPEDYPAIVEISNLLYPDNPTTVDEERFDDERFDRAKIFRRRLVAVDPSGHAVLGDVSYNHMPWAFDPHRYGVWVGVHPRWQRRGIGRLLAARLMDELRERRGAPPPARGPGAPTGTPRGGRRRRGRGGPHEQGDPPPPPPLRPPP